MTVGPNSPLVGANLVGSDDNVVVVATNAHNAVEMRVE